MADLLSRIADRARGKGALADLHPEVTDREHMAAYRSDGVSNYSPYSYLQALGDHERHVWVRKAIKVITDNYAPLPLRVMRADEVVADHSLAALLSAMNAQQSSVEVWTEWVIDMLLGGEEGWELIKNGSGEYVEIYPRQPHLLGVVPDPALRRYYVVDHYTIDDGLSKPYDLRPDELIHFKFFNPRNPWRGLSVVSAVRQSISIDAFAQAWARLFFRNNMRPDYAVVAPQGITKTEKDEMRATLVEEHRGLEHAHEPIILEQGVTDIKFLDFRPKDTEWLAQREMSRDEVGGMFGVPDILMGYGNDSYDTETKRTAALNVLFALTILPLANYRDTHLTEYFRRVEVLAPDERIVTDVSQVAALKSDLKDKLEMWDTLVARGTPPSVASSFIGLGLPRYEGDDVGYLSLTLVPATRATAAKGLLEPGRKFINKAIPYGGAEHQKLWDLFVKRTLPWEKKLGDVVAELFRRQQATVIKRLQAPGQRLFRQKDAADVAADPFDRDAWEQEFADGVHAVLTGLVEDTGQQALDDLNIGLDFNVSAPEVVRFLKQREQRFAQQVNDTTWQQLQDSLQAGLDAGENMPELIARVESVMGDRIRSSGEVIARTEVIGAANGGTLEAWRQTDVVEGKSWLSSLDTRVRPTHRDAHGQTVGLDEDFSVGEGHGQAPGEIGLAEEDIQCRCTMTAVLKTRTLARQPHGANGHRRMVQA